MKNHTLVLYQFYLKEFLLAIDVTSSGSPEEKLNWAFRYNNQVREFDLSIFDLFDL